MDQYYHAVLARKGFTTTPLTGDGDGPTRTMPDLAPAPWAHAAASAPQVPAHLAALAAQFDALDSKTDGHDI